MARKRLAPLTVDELRHLLKKDARLRQDLKRLRLKLTTSGRLVSTKKDFCVSLDFKPQDDPLILKRGASKRRK